MIFGPIAPKLSFDDIADELDEEIEKSVDAYVPDWKIANSSTELVDCPVCLGKGQIELALTFARCVPCHGTGRMYRYQRKELHEKNWSTKEYEDE